VVHVELVIGGVWSAWFLGEKWKVGEDVGGGKGGRRCNRTDLVCFLSAEVDA